MVDFITGPGHLLSKLKNLIKMYKIRSIDDALDLQNTTEGRQAYEESSNFNVEVCKINMRDDLY